MTGLFKKPKPAQIVMPPPPPPLPAPTPAPEIKIPPQPSPKPVRMPVAARGASEDPNASKRAAQYRSSAKRRKGRRSTILTSALRNLTGSSGQKLGG